MINFRSRSSTDNQLRLLSISELTKRLKESPDGKLIVWGFLVASSKGKLYKATNSISQIRLLSISDIEYLVYGPSKKPEPKSRFRFMALTDKEKLEKIFKASIYYTEDKSFEADKSPYYTEIYD